MSLKLVQRLRQSVFTLCLFSLVTSSLLAQTGGKRALTAQDFDAWKGLQGTAISRDGKFVAYVMQAQDGDGEVFVRSTSGTTEYRVPRGYRPPTPPPDPSDPAATQAFAALGRLLRPVFSADSKFVFFNLEPEKAVILKARKDKKKPEDMPKTALGIMDLSNGKVTRVDEVKSFQVPEDGSDFVAILKEPGKPEPAASPSPNANSNTAAPAAPQAPAKKKDYGSTLILRRLSDGKDRTFADVLEYSFAKDAKTLLYAVSSKKEETNGAYAVTPQTDAAPVALLSGPGKYTKFTWDEKQEQAAFISDKADAAAKQPKFSVYHWARAVSAASEVVSVKTTGFRPEFIVSEKGSLAFSYDGSRLFISNAPPPDPEPDPANAVPDEEKVVADLWHWKDDYVQPQQKVRMIADRDRSYRAVWHIADKKFVQLADTTMENVNPSSNGLYALGTDDRSYRIRGNYDPGFTDYYLVNTVDGSRKPLRQGLQFGMSWSPGAKYVVFFDGKDWNSISIPDLKVTNLTSKINIKFTREDHDSPSAAPSYGLAGWTKDDKQVLIYDRFDIWNVNADGTGAKVLTGGIGRKEKTELRYVRLDPDERFIEPGKDMLLRAESEETRDSGFYRVRLDGTPEKLAMDAKNFTTPVKARDASTMIVQASRFDMFPDVLVTGGDFKDLKKLSNGDAQRDPFIWGTSELIRYKSADGVPLQGVLIKPGNFDPKKKYPMLVYLYEKLSDTVNNFPNPNVGQNVNTSFYASNDYVIFLPDIVYKIGYPGKSALNCVLPGVDAVAKMGFVDEKSIGIQGHSWGGYQIAYMITQTNMFTAAEAGAPVSNMTSAYGGIRWESGVNRAMQYESGQSRIGKSLQEGLPLYLENSPLFHLDRVQTPLLILHNDQDGAVPWYQGIEMYIGMRRQGKEAYLFNYNNELHGIQGRANQKDWANRMQTFFDVKLKGAPEPEWMTKGIAAKDKGKDQLAKPVIRP